MGGMEDYYIAQFFCWWAIILLNLEIDIETFSSVNLAKAGVYRYAESPDFEVLLFGYSVDGGGVKVGDLVKGEKIPEEVMSALEDEAVTKWAFNAQFERIGISRMSYTHRYGDHSSSHTHYAAMIKRMRMYCNCTLLFQIFKSG
mgnify:CR=1 FL=1